MGYKSVTILRLTYNNNENDDDALAHLVLNNSLALGTQLYALLLECYSDRSEWKLGLNAVGEALQCVPPEFQVID